MRNKATQLNALTNLTMRENIGKTMLCLLMCLTSLAAQAQQVEYPCDSYIEKARYDKAEEKIAKALVKEPDATVYYAAYMLFSQKTYAAFDIKLAYDQLTKSLKLFLDADPDKRAKLEKHGYNVKAYDDAFYRACQIGLDEAKAQNTIESFNAYLNHFNARASRDQRDEATNLRNALAFADVLKTNTLESYNTFMITYPQAREYQQARKRRNALAYKEAEREGTQQAYEAFVKMDHKADEAPRAWDHIYQLAYNEAQRLDTEEAYRAYARQYPKSPYTTLATDKANTLEYIAKTEPGNWKSYRDYIEVRSTNTAICAVARTEIWAIARKGRIVEALNYGANTFAGSLRDSCLLLLHDIYAQSSDIRQMDQFYEKYNILGACEELQQLRTKDKAAINVKEWGSTDEFIRAAAPYYSAYVALQGLVADDIKAQRWAQAKKKVEQFAPDFGNDHCYQNLLAALSSPIDKTIKINNIGANINTKSGGEYCPVISADGKTMFFCGRDRKDNFSGEDIFMTQKRNGVWSKASGNKDINSVGNDAPLAISADGTKLIMFRSGSLCISHKERNGWSEPEKMPKNLNICDWQADAMISSDGRAFLFAARKNTPHDIADEWTETTNIYVSLMDENGDWGEPFDLGPTINAAGYTRSPLLHPDMKTLYFSSVGHGSLGDLDVFKSTRLRDDSWTEWSEPVNMGKEINTVGQECWYKISTDGKTAYFSKDDGDNEDIYWLNLPEKLRPNPVATISGHLTDTDGNPIVSKIKWEDLDLQQIVGESQTDPTDGSFFIILPMGHNYGYFIDDDKLFPLSDNLDLSKKNENVALENNLEVATIEKMVEDSVPMPMNNLFFSVGDSTLMSTSKSELTRVAKLITKIGRRVEIGGHTDDTGDDLRNQVLSEARAAEVKRFLISEGCPEHLLAVVGYGKSKPVASNKTVAGRKKNRRVEIRFIK